MFSRFSLVSILVFLLALLLVVPAAAGGWAVITLDSLPDSPVAGQPLDIGFMVRQHGVHPMSDLKPTVHAVNTVTGEQFTAAAKPDPDRKGHYQAVLNFPSQGTWEWSIEAFTMSQTMPALQVSAGNTAAASAAASPQGLASILPAGLGLLGAAGLFGGLLFFRRGKTRWAAGLGAAALIFAAVALVAAVRPAAPAEASSVTKTSADTGRDLFLAKGCVVCHTHSRAEYNEMSTHIGPALSDYSNSEEFLHTWLKDPQAVRKTTLMPQLELKEQEILDLIAFINASE